MEEKPLPPPGLDRKLTAFWSWNGDLPAPRITHWTTRGTFAIEAVTPGQPPITQVLFNGRRLGFGHHPLWDARNLYKGSYDTELGSKASEYGVPEDLIDWNDLGG
jgi:hypothetical protein